MTVPVRAADPMPPPRPPGPPHDAVELCCPRCLRLLGHSTASHLWVGGACFDGPVRLPCAVCGYRFRWGPGRDFATRP